MKRSQKLLKRYLRIRKITLARSVRIPFLIYTLFEINVTSLARGTKRKADELALSSFSSERLEALAVEAEASALERIKADQAEALKAKLPDFWLPSLTPTYTGGPGGIPRDLKDVKVVTTCRGGKDVHEIS